MLLTLAANRVADLVGPDGRTTKALLEVPDLAITQLELRGLNIFSSSLAGWDIDQLDTLRDRADKAACPCLVLIEDAPLDFVSTRTREKSKERIKRLATAAHRLGCNSIAIACKAPDTDAAFEATANEVRSAMPSVERFELNLLLAPTDGLTTDPDRLTELIKRIGGFRIGSLPSFGRAAESGDAIDVLRRLAPYAGAVHATVSDFTKAGKHKGGYDLAECVRAIKAVGFSNTLAIEFIGSGDSATAIEKARTILQAAIDED